MPKKSSFSFAAYRLVACLLSGIGLFVSLAHGQMTINGSNTGVSNGVTENFNAFTTLDAQSNEWVNNTASGSANRGSANEWEREIGFQGWYLWSELGTGETLSNPTSTTDTEIMRATNGRSTGTGADLYYWRDGPSSTDAAIGTEPDAATGNMAFNVRISTSANTASSTPRIFMSYRGEQWAEAADGQNTFDVSYTKTTTAITVDTTDNNITTSDNSRWDFRSPLHDLVSENIQRAPDETVIGHKIGYSVAQYIDLGSQWTTTEDIWFRFFHENTGSVDHGMAIDDFNFAVLDGNEWDGGDAGTGWNLANNWNGTALSSGTDQVAIFGGAMTGATTADLNGVGDQTLGYLIIDSDTSGHTVTITDSAGDDDDLIFDVTNGEAVINADNANGFSNAHDIQANIIMNDDLNILNNMASATFTVSGDITMNSNDLYVGAIRDPIILSGIINGNNGGTNDTNTITFIGPNDITLTGTSSGDFDGTFRILGGTVKTSGASAQNIIDNDVDLEFHGGTFDISGGTYGNAGVEEKIDGLRGDHGSIVLGSNNIEFGYGSDDTVVDTWGGVISGTGGVTKTGSNTNVLTATQTYTGATSIGNGALVIANGATLNSTSVTVGNSAGSELSVLSGTGTIAGTVLLDGDDGSAADGAISAGNLRTGDIGTLTITGNSTFEGGSSYVWEANRLTAGTEGDEKADVSEHDYLSFTGTLDLDIDATNSGKINIRITSIATTTVEGTSGFPDPGTYSEGHKILEASNILLDGADVLSDADNTDMSAYFNLNTSDFNHHLAANMSWEIYKSGDAIYIRYTVVTPEPSTYIMIGGLLLFISWRFRKKLLQLFSKKDPESDSLASEVTENESN